MQSSSEHQAKFSRLLPALFSIGQAVKALILHTGDGKKRMGDFEYF